YKGSALAGGSGPNRVIPNHWHTPDEIRSALTGGDPRAAAQEATDGPSRERIPRRRWFTPRRAGAARLRRRSRSSGARAHGDRARSPGDTRFVLLAGRPSPTPG